VNVQPDADGHEQRREPDHERHAGQRRAAHLGADRQRDQQRHLPQPRKYPSLRTFFNAYSGHGGKWDMSVFSSYGTDGLADGIVADMKKISDAQA